MRGFLPGGVAGHGWEAADRLSPSLRAAFPDAALAPHHVTSEEGPRMPPRPAARRSLHRARSGWGDLEAPTGAEVHVPGLSHAERGPQGLRRDRTLTDATAMLTQMDGA